ncbi:antifreeze protein [Infundibulicybe gibba]|nr:antifreeze protein [Infundibulicybe gibba]
MAYSNVVLAALLLFTHLATAAGPPAVNLRTAANFVVLAMSAISTVPDSAITGNVGLSPAAASFLTGFSLQATSTTFATSAQVNGELFGADFSAPTPATLTAAIDDMQAAQLDAAGRVNADATDLAAGSIGGLTFLPGLYKWTTDVDMATDIFILGDVTDTWIFQISGTFSTASSTNIRLAGGALPQNIVWVVSGAVEIGTTMAFQGVIFGSASITLDTGSSVHGRLFSQTAVALQQATVIQPDTRICPAMVCSRNPRQY